MNALIFDCDGVLADTERDGHRVAFNTVFAESGIEFAWSVEGYSEALKTAGGKERLRVLLAPEFRRQHGIPVGSDFGKAPATVSHERARAHATPPHDIEARTPCPMARPAA